MAIQYKVIINVLLGVYSLMPDSFKTIVCKVLAVLAVAIALFFSGYYFGYKVKTADVLEQQIEVITQDQQKQQDSQTQSIQTSEKIADELARETKTQYEIAQKYNEIKDDHAVLNERLPDDVISVLYNASVGQSKGGSTSRSNDSSARP